MAKSFYNKFSSEENNVSILFGGICMSEVLWIRPDEFHKRTNESIIMSILMGLNVLKHRKISSENIASLFTIVETTLKIIKEKVENGY